MRTAGLPQGTSTNPTLRPVWTTAPRTSRQLPIIARKSAKTGAASSGNASNATNASSGANSKLAVAAKISAARTLARKLAEEKGAAAAASQLASQRAVDPETAAELIRSAEAEVAELAKEAAQADAAARAAMRADKACAPQLQELQRLKEENRVLQELVMQLAANREEAERRLQDLKENGPEAASTGAPGQGNGASEVEKKASPVLKVPGSSKSTATQLESAVEEADKEGRRVVTIPDVPIPVGSTIKVLYNLLAGPLPDFGAPVLKLGWNRWETQTKVAMEHVPSLNPGSWWAADVAVPKLLFRMDFVVEDTNSGAVDNNGYVFVVRNNARTCDSVLDNELSVA